ncbi:MAG: oxidoreductase [Acidimicrobiia bacterium]|nr:oxidoreductase [Acidimicrobiia bacterium]
MAPKPRAAVVSGWSSDPNFLTAYSYLRPGGVPADRQRLGEPVAPGLFLAGEATSVRYPGTMHGAWFSGEDAARQAVAAGRGAAVVVIGAGLAGMAAARTLLDQGTTVTIVEAGPVPGGRVRVDRSLGGPVHLGAAWIHGDVGNPIAEAATRLGIRTAPSQWGRGTTFVAGHGPLSDTEQSGLEAKRASIDEAIAKATDAGGVDQALGPILRAEVARHSAHPLEQLVLDSWVRGIYENLYAAPVDDLSLLYAAEPFRMPGDDLTVLSGLDGLITALADDLDIHLREPARVVRADGAQWQVETERTAYRADAVIVTVPIGVLQAGAITFDPPLPISVQRSISLIGAGRIGKLFVTFDEPFWRSQWSFWTLSDPPSPVQLWADSSALAGQPTLTGFFTREAASSLEAMSSAELLEVVRSALSPMW